MINVSSYNDREGHELEVLSASAINRIPGGEEDRKAATSPDWGEADSKNSHEKDGNRCRQQHRSWRIPEWKR
jgi:hypothetical protein